MRRPRVSVNMAISLDGKIATKAYTPARFTSAADGQRLLQLRAGADALLVGRGTLEADTMRMIVPAEVLGERPGPLRCIVSRKGCWDVKHPVFQSEGPAVILYSHCVSASPRGVEAVEVNGLLEVMEDLYDRGVKHLHCEGGGMLLYEMMENDWVDDLFLTWAAGVAFGGATAPSIVGEAGAYLPQSREFEIAEFMKADQGECFLHYKRVRENNS